ncbi:hypothetical protein FOCC_FOCC005305 [Frankliniella occidentalis]|nr:hypothetical protein FOCC_FOCC005305 [Frankliniella occidentalis]
MATYRRFKPSDLDLALNAIRNAGMSIRSAAKNYGIPYVTLNRHYKGKKEEPSDRWYKAFMKRQALSLRQPENMSAARFRMATTQVRDEFFTKLKDVYDNLLPLGLKADQIYNTDETGLCVVTKSGKVVAPKGSRNVRARSGGERGENITAIVTVNSTGNHILPPTLIYRGKSLNFDLTDGAPEESTKLIRRNKIKQINRYQVARVLNPAWVKAITPANIQGGFKGSGVWPYNPNAIHLPGLESNSNLTPTCDQTPPSGSDVERNPQALARKSLFRFAHHNAVSTTRSSIENETINPRPLRDITESNQGTPVVEAVRSLLQPCEEVPSKPSRRITVSRLITCDEFRRELVTKEAEKERKEKEKRDRQDKRKRAAETSKPVTKTTNKKKRKNAEPDLSECDSPSEVEDISSESEADNSENEDNEKCGLCNGSFQNDFNGEQWIQCKVCKTWFHMKCLRLQDYNPDFVCEECVL